MTKMLEYKGYLGSIEIIDDDAPVVICIAARCSVPSAGGSAPTPSSAMRCGAISNTTSIRFK